MMQKPVKHAHFWPHSFIILTRGPCIGQKGGKNEKEKKDLRTVNREAERIFLIIHAACTFPL